MGLFSRFCVWPPSAVRFRDIGFRLAQIGPNKILTGIPAGEFSSENRVPGNARIAIFPSGLNPGANDIPYATHAALEIDHARNIGGSSPAPLCALAAKDRNRISYRRALQRAGGDRGRRVRHVLGTPVLTIRSPF